MKATILEEYNKALKIGDRETPKPGEGEVLIRIKAAGINPVDAKLAEGYMKENLPHKFPLTLGWEMAGVIEACGHSARRFRIGEEVYAYARRQHLDSGTFAEYIVIPESYIAKKPINISFEEAGSIPLAGLTAYQAIFDNGKLQNGEKLLIIGASGGVGTFAVQLAKYHGAKVIAVASAKNHEYLKELGADHCIDYKSDNLVQSVKTLFPEGVDLVLDAIGGDTTVEGSHCLTKEGRLVSLRNTTGEGIAKDVNFKFMSTEPNSRELDHIREIVEAGNIKVPLQKVYKLEEINEAFQQIKTGHTTGKIVFSLN